MRCSGSEAGEGGPDDGWEGVGPAVGAEDVAVAGAVPDVDTDAAGVDAEVFAVDAEFGGDVTERAEFVFVFVAEPGRVEGGQDVSGGGSGESGVGEELVDQGWWAAGRFGDLAGAEALGDVGAELFGAGWVRRVGRRVRGGAAGCAGPLVTARR